MIPLTLAASHHYNFISIYIQKYIGINQHDLLTDRKTDIMKSPHTKIQKKIVHISLTHPHCNPVLWHHQHTCIEELLLLTYWHINRQEDTKTNTLTTQYMPWLTLTAIQPHEAISTHTCKGVGTITNGETGRQTHWQNSTCHDSPSLQSSPVKPSVHIHV